MRNSSQPEMRPVDCADAGERLIIEGDVGDRVRARLWAHLVAHQFQWAGYRSGRWKWPAVPPGGGAFLLVLTIVAWAAWRGLVPGAVVGVGDIPQSVRDRAAVLFVLCWLPAMRYLLRPPGRRRPIPFFATYGCLYSAYYAVSPMLGISNLLMVGGWAAGHPNDPVTAYNTPVDVLFGAWLLLLVWYWAGGSLRISGPSRVQQLFRKLPERRAASAAFAVLGVGLAVTLVDRVGLVPLVFAGLVTLVKLVIQTAIVVLIFLARRRTLSPREIAFAIGGSAATVFLELGGSATGGVMFVLFAVFTGFWVGQRAVSLRYLILGLIALAGCVAIRGVMDEWRTTVWIERNGEIPPIERSRLMVDMLSEQVRTRGAWGALAAGWTAISKRSANTDLLIDVMRRTPHEIPYWNGFTYTSLVGAFVPRLLWPDKPQKSLGQDFGHRYGYIARGDTQTSVNLPVVIEFYINFGLRGVFAGMFLLGILLRAIEDAINRPGQGYLITAAAAPLLARLLVMECDLSLMFGGLPMQLGTLYLGGQLLLMLAGLAPARGPARAPWYAPIFPKHQGVATEASDIGRSNPVPGRQVA